MEEPLVSIIVITYNSAKYVFETLESARFQTYINIELIISDDCSTDNTVEICQAWIAENRSRFSRIVLIASPVNTGIPANCNRGIMKAKGDWLKLIAGDDALLATAIDDYIGYVKTNPKAKLLYAYSYRYRDFFKEDCFITRYPSKYPEKFVGSDSSAESQYKILLKANRINAPTVFVSREAIFKVGSFDERFKLLEDYPMWLNLTRSGYKFFFLDKTTVCHRSHVYAVFSHNSEALHKEDYFRNEEFRECYIYPNIIYFEKIKRKYEYKVRRVLAMAGLNVNTRFAYNIDKLFAKYLNLFNYLNILQKAIYKTERK